MNSVSKNILVFNLNWLGDILFSLPSLEAIKAHTPNSHLACIVPPPYRSLLEHQKGIDEIIAMSDKTLWEKYRLLRYLKQKKWDIGFLFHRSKTRARLLKWANVQERVGYDSNHRSRLLTYSIPSSSAPQHKMDMIRSLLLSYGISQVKESYDYRPTLKTQFNLPSRYVVFHPGSNWAPKRWPIQHYADLGQKLVQKYNIQIIITGSQEDSYLAHQIQQNLKQSIIDLTGKTSLPELAYILSKAWIVIAGDTGPMHLAAASGANVIALYGPTSPLLNGPRGHQFKVIWENPGCKTHPCKDKDCPHDISLKKITPQRVLTEIENWEILHGKNTTC